MLSYFGGGLLISVGDADVFVASYDLAGTHRWSKRFGNTYADRGRVVALGSSGDITVTGSFPPAPPAPDDSPEPFQPLLS